MKRAAMVAGLRGLSARSSAPSSSLAALRAGLTSSTEVNERYVQRHLFLSPHSFRLALVGASVDAPQQFFTIGIDNHSKYNHGANNDRLVIIADAEQLQASRQDLKNAGARKCADDGAFSPK